jgi:hypothetical protein
MYEHILPDLARPVKPPNHHEFGRRKVGWGFTAPLDFSPGHVIMLRKLHH